MSKDGYLETKRHSLAHLMAASIQELHPGAKFGVGPVIEDGFYYDVHLDQTLAPEDLQAIEALMREKIKKGLRFECSELPIEDATKMFGNMAQDFKVELLDDLQTRGTTAVADLGDENLVGSSVKEVSIYTTGNFIDLCRGPHVGTAAEIDPDSFRLTRISGAYWRGNQAREQMQRVYGVAFHTKKELEEYFVRLEEAKKRDHRKVGVELRYFAFSDEVGVGLPLWMPKGETVRHILEEYMREVETRYGYQYIRTPEIAKGDLYRHTGHLPYYADSMYKPIMIDEVDYYLRPMNCPHHHQVYRAMVQSYRDLPLRLAEAGNCYRYERSGVLYGIIRARSFTQNDAHIYVTEDQVKEEFVKVLEMFREVYAAMKITGHWLRLSLPDFEKNPEKYGGDLPLWEQGANLIRDAMREFGADYTEETGEAAFYGPKIDVQIRNVLGKEDTIATNQLDIVMPRRLGLTYTGTDNTEHFPLVLHRAILGSYERFVAFLIEQTAGELPLWLAPIQARLLPVADRHSANCAELRAKMLKAGLRVETDARSESISRRIRESELEKIPYLLVVGDKEMESGLLPVRSRKTKTQESLPLDGFIGRLHQEISAKS